MDIIREQAQARLQPVEQTCTIETRSVEMRYISPTISPAETFMELLPAQEEKTYGQCNLSSANF